jgi:hypothetical protein
MVDPEQEKKLIDKESLNKTLEQLKVCYNAPLIIHNAFYSPSRPSNALQR